MKATAGSRYRTLMARYPLLGGACQQSLVVSCANVTRQWLSTPAGHDFTISWSGVQRAAFVAATIAVQLKLWYNMLDRAGIKSVVGKTMADQGIGAFYFNFYALGMFAFLNGVSVPDVPSTILTMRNLNLIFISWTFWVPFKAAMFRFVPPANQIAVGALGSYVWNIFMFYYTNN
eukprot:FR736296.1.p1 GENE.FR736296.1~~FR736296.1.p1  ORF type:complete len:190 (+),score=13.85 FR736296.1:47-571(+)